MKLKRLKALTRKWFSLANAYQMIGSRCSKQSSHRPVVLQLYAEAPKMHKWMTLAVSYSWHSQVLPS